MRIISGAHKGFRFPHKNMPHVRPTTDRAKESLFNILNQHYDFSNIRVLDLYSGIGSIALEFCSRGAKEVVAVDFNRKSIQYIRDIAQRLNIQKLQIRQIKALQYLKSTTDKFNVIFADPPYDAHTQIHDLIKQMQHNPILDSGGIFILEHKTMMQLDHPSIIESRIYGQSTFSFFNFVHQS